MMIGGWRLEDGLWIAPDGMRLRAISGGKGGGTTTVVNQTPAKTPEELELIQKQNSILDIQIQELRRQNDALQAIFPEQQKLLAAQTQAAIAGAEAQRFQTNQLVKLAELQAPLLEEQTGLARKQVEFQGESLGLAREQLDIQRRAGDLQRQLIDRALKEIEGTPEEQEIRKLSNQRALAILKGEAPPLLPGQQEKINEIFGRASEEAQTGLKQFGEDLALSRGLRVTDTPIGGELLRQGRELARDLSSAKARAELDVGASQQQFSEAVRQFQEGLKQQAFANRLALTGRSGPAGAGGGTVPFALPLLSGGGMNPTFSGVTSQGALGGAQGLLDILGRDRLGQASQTSRGPGIDNTGQYVSAGIGAAASIASALILSSARFKKDIRPYDKDEYARALDKLNATPITRWKYTHEPESQRPHTGPILELSPEDIKASDTHLDLISYSGLLHAGLKEVDRKVERLAARLPVASTRGARLPIPARAA